MLALNLGLILLGGFLLWFGAEWIVSSAAAIARALHIPELIIGLTVVAMGTSAPEFTVTFLAALTGQADLSLSNVVGSNVFNMGVILGLTALIKPIPVARPLIHRDFVLLWLIHLATALMVWDLTLSRFDGGMLFMVFLAYVTSLCWLGLRASRRGRAALAEDPTLAQAVEGAEDADGAEAHRPATPKDYAKLLVGFLAISLGGTCMVEGATAVAQAMGISQWLIGLTVVAAGTSLPELVTCLVASLKGRNEMLLGNLVGSDIFNFAGVLGLTGSIAPLSVSPSTPGSMALLVGSMLLIGLIMRSGWRVSRLEGGLILGIGLARWGFAFLQ